MSIVDRTLQRLDGSGTASKAGAAPTDGPDAHMAHDLLYVAGARKARAPWVLWLLLPLAGAALAYWLLAPALPGAAPALTPSSVVSAAPEAPPAALVALAPQAAQAAQAPMDAAQAPAAAAAVAAPSLGPAPAPSAVAAIVAPAPAPAAPAANAMPAPEWIERGWDLASREGLMQALPVWEQGLQTLPDAQLLLVGHAFLDRHGMNSALARRAADWAAFAVREASATRQGLAVRYRVVLLLPTGVTPVLEQQVAAQFGRSDRIRAATLKRRVARAGGVQPAVAAAPELVVAAPAAPAARPTPAAAPAATVASAMSVAPATPAAPVHSAASAQAHAAPTAAASPNRPTRAPEIIALPPPPQAALLPEPAPTPPPVRPDRREWEARTTEVRELMRQGAFGPVAERAESLMRDFPDRWEPQFWFGTAALAQGRLPQAEQALDRALELNAGVAQVWIQRGIVAQERGDHSAAVRFLSQAAQMAPRLPEAHLNLGFSLDAIGRTSEAERSLSTFLVLTEGNPAYALQRQHIEQRLARR